MPIAGALHDRIGQDVQLAIEALGLTGTVVGTGGVAVYLQTLPDETNVQFPCVLVSYEAGQEEDGEDSSFETDGVVFPISVWIADHESRRQENPSPRPDYLAWRDAIAELFRGYMTLPDCPEVFDVRVFPQKVFDERLPYYRFLMSGLVVKFHTSRPRQGR